MERLLAVFGYSVGIATTCFLAGAVVTWVRFQSLAGVGDIAVVSGDRAEFVTTGLNSIVGTALVAAVIGLLLLGCFVLWTHLQRRPPRTYMRLVSFSGAVGGPVYRYVAHHPWRAHLVGPILAMAVAKFVLPGFVAIPLAFAALLSVLAGLVRGLAELVARLAEGRSSVARRARIPVFGLLAVAFLAFLLVSLVSWTPVAAFIVAAVFAPVFIWRGAGVPANDWTLSLLLNREPRLMAAVFVALAVASAVASEADRPSGLTVARVTPVHGEAFDAIPLGQHSGRSVFMNLKKLRAEGVVELAPGNLRSVAITRTGVYGPADERSLGRRFLDWASQPNWAIEE